MGAQSPLPCWCGSPGEWTLQFRTDRFGLLRCRNCTTFQINPPAIVNDELSGEFYTSYYGARDDDTQSVAARPISPQQINEAPRKESSRFWAVARRDGTLYKPGEVAIDIGCGDGGLCAELAAAGWKSVIGIDVARVRVATAKRRYPGLTFHCGTIDDCGVARQSVELAIMDNIIEHLPAPLAFIRNVRKYLKPGGRLVVITPNMESGGYRLLGRRWTPELAPHVHLFLFTTASLVQLLRTADLSVEHTGTFTKWRPDWRLPFNSLGSGRPKESLWHFGQFMGNLYGRARGQGEMVFAAARVPI
jgi:2-polyprenyl-3-methyl-5-hydroxy-6-metoxy-1,4-benzoquinol methylase